jgi:hypothetical protein
MLKCAAFGQYPRKRQKYKHSNVSHNYQHDDDIGVAEVLAANQECRGDIALCSTQRQHSLGIETRASEKISSSEADEYDRFYEIVKGEGANPQCAFCEQAILEKRFPLLLSFDASLVRLDLQNDAAGMTQGSADKLTA